MNRSATAGALKNLHVNYQRPGGYTRHTELKSVPPLEEQRPFEPGTGI